jgi:hypothetical protein
MEPIKVELTEDQIAEMSDSEKLSTLIRIAFHNHTRMNEQSKIICGNGDPSKGLCSQVAFQRKQLCAVWAILGAAGMTILGMIAAMVAK